MPLNLFFHGGGNIVWMCVSPHYNKFMWDGSEEFVVVDRCKLKLSECFMKPVIAGQVLCINFNDDINYAPSGKKALISHIKLSKHIQAWLYKVVLPVIQFIKAKHQ